ncbi:hypothetical protein EDB81DRAFT_654868 [Dactylonectria macrodidyma]|uniref:RING-type E3 ubiquitin transferase n=1 Tax=Dactylonectria macrodidyma TaxID=307937 RepID=A0A9P9J3F6_9HYPO|nr:hypothetical protein EDB81DRAFT_654868 [Dactylonectria macrodidyma]
MFTQPVSSPPPGPSPATATTASRPSRLRGLSYLRNYTQNHLLSRDGHHSGNVSGSGSGSTSPNRHTVSLTRSLSHSPTTTGPPPPAQINHLTLVSSTPDPVRISLAAATSASSTTNTTITTATATTPPVPTPTSSMPLANSSNSTSSLHSQPASTGDAPNPAAASDPLTTPTPGDDQPAMTRTRASTAGDAVTNASNTPDTMPSIRFSAYYDPRSTRPSLTFPPISRTLPTGSEKIRVGRYSERDSHSMANLPGNQPSAAPVGFKSKVVSRRHCEFWYEDGKWYIKDVKSSSGTFLNHIRLSPPSQESKAFPVNDGDIVQLGIDFKGGEEMIFRCVKMRLELNRGWQNKLNTFNMAAHKRLQTMATSGAASSSSQDCSICLSSIAPCQSLFVAPCSHTWHFKCVRSLLMSPQYPIFICPNCRAGADLEADVDELAEEWEQLKSEEEAEAEAESGADAAPAVTTAPAVPVATPEALTPEPQHSDAHEVDPMDVTVNITPESPMRGSLPHTVSEPLPIRSSASGAGRHMTLRDSRTPSPPGLTPGVEGPITPRNNAGPWVFDGSAGRNADATTAEMRSLDAAADMDVNGSRPSDDSGSR